MLFSSWQFILVFLPITLAVFFLLSNRWRTASKVWLILASLFFYAYWKIEYVPLLLFSVGFNYGVANALLRFREHRRGWAILFGGVSINLLLLGYFKYTNFIAAFFGKVVNQDWGHFDIILPLAISFFTFTQIGYLVDVYRDHTRHYRFLDYFLFVVFFPHLIAGPIVRHWEIIPQYADKDLRPTNHVFGVGVMMFLFGLFKKVLVADTVSRFAILAYGAAAKGTTLSFFDAWLGTLAYALQIYFDFSGYSDMAIGLACMFGMKFPCNFDSPYQAGSINEFWSRWHISLTRFLREYVYFALGGNRCSRYRQALNVLLTFLLSGLWHGAGWTFVIWGGLHGLMLVIHTQWRNLVRARGWLLRYWSYRCACVLLTFTVVLFTWVFFRAPTVASAGRVLASMVGGHGLTVPESLNGSSGQARQIISLLGATVIPDALPLKSPDYRWALKVMVVLLAVVWFMPNTQQLLSSYKPILEPIERPTWLHAPVTLWTGLACGVLFLFVLRGYFVLPQSPFLYFNF